jgi:integrase
MNPRRRTVTDPVLPGRVYPKSGTWYWFPKGGTWIKLCRIEEGETKMLERLAAEKRKREAGGTGDMPKFVDDYVKAERHNQKDRSWPSYGNRVKKDFADVMIRHVDSTYVSEFLENNWSDKPHMQGIMRAFLRRFFRWAKKKRYFTGENPCNDVQIARRPRRDVYITHEHFGLIRQHLAAQPMLVCMIDLCYLTAQRSTEIRALLWRPETPKSNWVDRDASVIHFNPSKTLESSGLSVDWQISPDIEEVLERARGIGKVKSNLVIHSKTGKAITPKAALYHWHAACLAAGVDRLGYTIKDIRAKALTDAMRAGYDLKAIMEAAAHAKQSTTETYFKQKAVPLSEIVLKLPKSA